MRLALVMAGAVAALAMAAPAHAGLFDWLGGKGGVSAPSSGGGASDAMDVPAPPALALFAMAVTGLILGRRRRP